MNLEFGNKTSTLQFMSPQLPEQPLGDGAGLMYNFAVEDVIQEYEKLANAGLAVTAPP